MKCLPQLETMSVRVPCFAKTCDKKIQARSSTSISQKVGMNSAILVRQHTTTRIVSCPLDKGSPSMKSIEIESQGLSLIGRNQCKPKGLLWRDLLQLQTEHEWIYSV